MLAARHNRQGEQRAATIKSPSLLAGKVFDEAGEPLVASHACKGKVRYRYYVSRSLQHDGQSTSDGWRIPSKELEGAVIAKLAGSLDQPLDLLDQLGAELDADTLAATMSRAAELAKAVRTKRASNIRPLVERVNIASDHLTISLDRNAGLSALGLKSCKDTGNPTLTVDARLTRAGHSFLLIEANGRRGAPKADETLVQLVLRARAWWEEVTSGGMTIAELARSKDINSSFVSRTVRLAFLSPKIVEAILAGTQPAHLSAQKLRNTEIPLCWSDQHELLGF